MTVGVRPGGELFWPENIDVLTCVWCGVVTVRFVMSDKTATFLGCQEASDLVSVSW